MNKTGCKYGCKSVSNGRIICSRDNSIRTPGFGCKGKFCTHYEPILWEKLFKSKCKRCVYYEPIGQGVGKCNHPRDFCDYMYYVRGNSTSCPLWDEIKY